jgi:hypothetical protein
MRCIGSKALLALVTIAVLLPVTDASAASRKS